MSNERSPSWLSNQQERRLKLALLMNSRSNGKRGTREKMS